MLRLAVAITLFGLVGCSSTRAPSPFVEDAGGPDASADAAVDAPSDGPGLGHSCVDDSQCDDGNDCTHDGCNRAIGRCQFTPDDARCQNGVFCDGIERCDALLCCRN